MRHIRLCLTLYTESKLFLSPTAARDTVRRIVFEEVRELLGGMANADEELRALGDEAAHSHRDGRSHNGKPTAGTSGHRPRERHRLVPSASAGNKGAHSPSDSGSGSGSAASDSVSSSSSPSLSDSQGSQKGGAPGQKLPDRLANLVIHKVFLHLAVIMFSLTRLSGTTCMIILSDLCLYRSGTSSTIGNYISSSIGN